MRRLYTKEAQDCLDTDTPIPMLRLIAQLEEDNLSGLYMGGQRPPGIK